MKYISKDCLKKQNIYLGNICVLKQKKDKEFCVDYTECCLHNNAIIYFCSEGAHYSLPNGTSIKPKAGDVLYIPVGAAYKVEINECECEFYSIFFDLLDEENEKLFFFENLMCIYAGSTKLPKLMLECVRTGDSGSGNGLLLRSYMYSILHEFVSCVETEISKKSIDTAISYINENLGAGISVKELARRSFMSERAFNYAFKESVGLSPVKYINSERMKKAALLLKESDISVGTVSDMVGYNDKAYFHKMFKKTYNCTPLEYRNSQFK